MKVIDHTGQRFGRLVAVRPDGKRGSFVAWMCVCDCGNARTISGASLRSGRTQSCGCYHDECAANNHRTHGLSYTAEYRVWSGIITRCFNKNARSFARYGGRGVTVCRKWRGFPAFLADMGPRPSPKHTIERTNNDLGYGPANCVWATAKQQARNKSTSRLIDFKGERRCVAEWAERHGIKPGIVFCRIYRGWGVERALTTPVVSP